MIKILAVSLLFTVMPASAQNTEPSSVYGTVISNAGTVRNSAALFIGGRGGWIFDHTYAVGIEGYMLMNNIDARIPDTSGNHYLTMSYGGIELEYIAPFGGFSYLTFHTLIGGGSISHKEIPYLDRRQYHDPFAVVEPSVSIEVAAANIFRIGMGASYRQVAWLKSSLATQEELSGPSAFLFFKVGFL